MKKLPVEQAVGLPLAHDLTEVSASCQRKRVAFSRGHVVRMEDVVPLRRLGKNQLYVGTVEPGSVHEDDAALLLAPHLAGEGIEYDLHPKEGKVNFRTTGEGLFRVDIEALTRLNRLGVPSMPTIHDRFPVAPGKTVAAFRIIPLCCERALVDQMLRIAEHPLIWVEPYRITQAAIVVTGTEVYSGAVEDRFVARLSFKLRQLGVEPVFTTLVPDDSREITAAIEHAAAVARLVLVTGGTSVDPDDVTNQAMADAGVTFVSRGNPLQPGNHLSLGQREDRIFCSVPAAALHFNATALDVFLPRLLVEDMPDADELAQAGHGGLCHFCEPCVYPVCPFGRP
jgi:molybdenum cofactor synthesis domain-containing protein